MSISYLSVCSTWNRKFKKRVGRTVHGPCTLRPIYFFIFPTKTEKGHITYPYYIAYFKVQKKRENGQENRSFFHFSNFEVKFKNTKNTVN